MSRVAIASILIADFVAALAFAAFMELSNPTPWIHTTSKIVSTFGGALAPLAFTGILPLVIWAVFRFKAARAQGPIVLWGALGAILLYLIYLGETASWKERIGAELPTTGLSALEKLHRGSVVLAV